MSTTAADLTPEGRAFTQRVGSATPSWNYSVSELEDELLHHHEAALRGQLHLVGKARRSEIEQRLAEVEAEWAIRKGHTVEGRASTQHVGSLAEGYEIRYMPGGETTNYSVVALRDGKVVGAIQWKPGREVWGGQKVPADNEWGYTIENKMMKRPPQIVDLKVNKGHQRKGLATAMYELAKHHEPDLVHDDIVLPDGEAWMKTLGSLPGEEEWVGWRPTHGMYAPGQDHLDPRIFNTDDVMRPDVRAYLLQSLDAYWTPKYGQWQKWAKVYLAGSGAGFWWNADTDLDILVGVDLDTLRAERPANQGISDVDIIASLNKGLIDDLRPTMEDHKFADSETGFDVTFFVNPGSYDIRALHPYAAYDITGDSWMVIPERLPADWGPHHIAEEIWQHAETVAREAIYTLGLPEPERTAAGIQLFDWVHEGRRAAYSAHGQGVWDPGQVTYQYLEQRSDRLLRRLYILKHPESASQEEVERGEAGQTLLPMQRDQGTYGVLAQQDIQGWPVLPVQGVQAHLHEGVGLAEIDKEGQGNLQGVRQTEALEGVCGEALSRLQQGLAQEARSNSSESEVQSQQKPLVHVRNHRRAIRRDAGSPGWSLRNVSSDNEGPGRALATRRPLPQNGQGQGAAVPSVQHPDWSLRGRSGGGLATGSGNGGVSPLSSMKHPEAASPEEIEKGQQGIALTAEHYWMNHRPNDDGPRAFDLNETDLAPDDIYTHPERYTGFRAMIPETMETLRAAKGKPNSTIKIYRAQPGSGLNPGDWVSMSRAYAQTDLDSYPEGRKVQTYEVAASTVRWAGDDLMEWGYYGSRIGGKTAAKELPGIIAEFSAAHPDLQYPMAAYDMCHPVSEAFVKACKAAGIKAEVVSGVKIGESEHFPGVKLLMQGHFGVLINGHVYDWTIRQFEHEADVPKVWTKSEWDREWNSGKKFKVGRRAIDGIPAVEITTKNGLNCWHCPNCGMEGRPTWDRHNNAESAEEHAHLCSQTPYDQPVDLIPADAPSPYDPDRAWINKNRHLVDQHGRGHVGAKEDTSITHAGIALQAEDTGRVLLLQRAYDPEDAPNVRGTWEFPGGGLDDGETPQKAAWREFCEETGLPKPKCDLVGTWTSNEIYQGFLFSVPSEADAFKSLNPNADEAKIPNPDAPKHPDVTAWFTVDQIKALGPAVRPEVVTGTDWDLFRKRGTDVLLKAAAGEWKRHESGWIHSTGEWMLERAARMQGAGTNGWMIHRRMPEAKIGRDDGSPYHVDNGQTLFEFNDAWYHHTADAGSLEEAKLTAGDLSREAGKRSTFWRVHPEGRAFGEWDAHSKPFFNQPDAEPQKGYSCFENPWHLYLYVLVQWSSIYDGTTTLRFPGEEVGRGHDGEPLVIPSALPFKTTWGSFCEMLPEYPLPSSPVFADWVRGRSEFASWKAMAKHWAYLDQELPEQDFVVKKFGFQPGSTVRA